MGALNSRCRGHRAAGFTLVELGITLAIGGILVMLAVPSLTTLIVTQQVRTGATDLQGSLYFARSEALKRGANVEIIPVGDDWKNGWKVQLADGTLLRTQPALNPRLSAISVTTGTKVVYRSDGHVTTAPATMIVRAADNAGVAARCVAVDLSGRPTLTTDTDGNPGNGCN
jgi:type IV fimbrial biogenesis protein FimT